MKPTGRNRPPVRPAVIYRRSWLAFASFLLLFPLQGCSKEQTCSLALPSPGIEVIDVSAPQRFVAPPHGALGASTLYYFDDDETLASPALGQALKTAGLTTLRFPGGELADNYDWETHSLERPHAWPGEAADAAARAARTDYLEFLEFARRHKIKNLFFVVNVDGAFRAKGNRQENIRKYAEKAARWVAAVKENGFKVSHWEIGNEPELPGSLPLTAAEYAGALKAFSAAMRAADPEIQIGAAGPNKLNGVGFADRLTTEQLAYLRAHGGNSRAACRGLSPTQCVNRIRRAVPGQAQPEPWWHTVAKLAGDSFDFIAVHRYTLVDPQRAQQRDGRMHLTARLQRLRNFLQAKLRGQVQITVTEWNTPSRKQSPLSKIRHLLEVAMQLGNNLAGGVDFMHYWPMRTPSDDFQPMLASDGSAGPVARLHALVREAVADSVIAEHMPAPGVYLLHTDSDQRSGLLAINLNEIPVALRWQHKRTEATRIRMLRLHDNGTGQVKESHCAEHLTAKQIIPLTLPPSSASVMNIR